MLDTGLLVALGSQCAGSAADKSKDNNRIMTSLTLLLIIVLLVWFWQVNQQCHDTAVQLARQTCKHQGLQFLDGTATLKSIRPYFSRDDGPGLKRTYTFDYSEDGMDRHSGCIIMHNAQVASLLLDGE
jgi:hypothetical protein